MLDMSNKNALYSVFYRKKKNGKRRIIHAPCEELKDHQRILRNRLVNEEWMSDFCHGFIKGKSTTDAACVHVGQDWVLNIDIAEFFPSIKAHMLTFLDQYEKEIATLDSKLVQGSPCSPVISNIVLRDFDEELFVKLEPMQINFSRYADDITLSGYGKPDVGELINIVRSRLRELGFDVRDNKIEYMYKNKSQKVLGITVNEKVSLNRKIRKNLRAAIYNGKVTDVEMGHISYLKSVNKDQYHKLMQYKETCDAKRGS
jgi:retron-type reverse transcriptase